MATKNPDNSEPKEEITAEVSKQAGKGKRTRSKAAAAKKADTNVSAGAKSEASAKTPKPKKPKKTGTGAKKTRSPVAKAAVEKTDEGSKDAAPPPVEPESPPEPQATQTVEDQSVPVDTAQPSTSQTPPEAEADITERTEPPREEARPPETPPAPPACESVTPAPPDSEPLPAVVKYFIAGLALLIALIVLTSYQNMQKFYVVAQHGALEIWKGDFSPMGRELVVIMPGVLAPAASKPVYTMEEVYPIIFQYYLEKADALLDVPGAPDFSDIKEYLNRAAEYALTDEMKSAVKSSANGIDRTILLYKSDVAADKGTIEDLESAKAYLKQAALLNPDDPEANLIQQKIEAIDNQIGALESKQAQEAAETPTQENPSPEATTPEKSEAPEQAAPEPKAPQSKEQSF